MKIPSRAVLLVLLAASGPAAAAPERLPDRMPGRMEVELGARPVYWFGELSGDVRAQHTALSATRLDFESGLDMDTDRGILTGELFMKFGDPFPRHRLSARAWTQTFRGEKVLTQAVTFETFTFAAATTVSSRLGLEEVELRYAWDFWQASPDPKASNRPSALWAAAGVKVLRLDMELASPALGTVEEAVTVPFPVLGLGGRLSLGRHLSIQAEAVGLSVDVSGESVDFLEAEGVVRWDFNRYLALEAGWRRWDLGFDADSTSTDLDGSAVIEGVILALEARF